ncbi:MAG: hypothetical protein Q8R00_00335 [Candidatus Nanoarchaeia archaeon]|nr:hypothetical protein [Candidatus Nanoarchaeia archaeon]
MKEEEVIKQVKECLTLIKANPSKLYNFLSATFGLLDRLKNKEKVKVLKGKLIELQSLTDERSIVVKVEELSELIKGLNEENKNPYINTFLGKHYGVRKYEYSPSYLKDLNKYKSILKYVKDAEERLLTDPLYVSHHHEKIDHGHYETYLHARIKRNLRIMYKLKNGTLTFYRIITKNEFEDAK